jgi:hypothetical protein
LTPHQTRIISPVANHVLNVADKSATDANLTLSCFEQGPVAEW